MCFAKTQSTRTIEGCQAWVFDVSRYLLFHSIVSVLVCVFSFFSPSPFSFIPFDSFNHDFPFLCFCSLFSWSVSSCVLLMSAVSEDKVVESNKCAQCGKSGGVKLLVCVRCQSISYCSNQCQALHWPQHKKRCGFSFKSSLSFSPFAFSDVLGQLMIDVTPMWRPSILLVMLRKFRLSLNKLHLRWFRNDSGLSKWLRKLVACSNHYPQRERMLALGVLLFCFSELWLCFTQATLVLQ